MLARRLQKAGHKRPDRSVTGTRADQAAEWCRGGTTQNEIARRLSCSRTAVRNMLTRAGISGPDQPAVDESIVAAYKAGESIRRIASRTHIDRKTIRNHLRRAGTVVARSSGNPARKVGERSKPPTSSDTLVKVGGQKGWIRLQRWAWDQAHGPVPKSACILQIEDNGTDGEAEDLGNLVQVGRGTRALLNRRSALAGTEGHDLRLSVILATALSCCDPNVQMGRARMTADGGTTKPAPAAANSFSEAADGRRQRAASGAQNQSENCWASIQRP